MDFNKLKNKINIAKKYCISIFKKTTDLFNGNQKHAIFFWSVFFGFLLLTFLLPSFSTFLKIFAFIFFIFNFTRVVRGLEDILETITKKDVEIFSMLFVSLEISLGLLSSTKFFYGFIAESISLLILAAIFSQYLRYFNNKEYLQYEKEIKIDAINNPKKFLYTNNFNQDSINKELSLNENFDLNKIDHSNKKEKDLFFNKNEKGIEYEETVLIDISNDEIKSDFEDLGTVLELENDDLLESKIENEDEIKAEDNSLNDVSNDELNIDFESSNGDEDLELGTVLELENDDLLEFEIENEDEIKAEDDSLNDVPNNELNIDFESSNGDEDLELGTVLELENDDLLEFKIENEDEIKAEDNSLNDVSNDELNIDFESSNGDEDLELGTVLELENDDLLEFEIENENENEDEIKAEDDSLNEVPNNELNIDFESSNGGDEDLDLGTVLELENDDLLEFEIENENEDEIKAEDDSLNDVYNDELNLYVENINDDEDLDSNTFLESENDDLLDIENEKITKAINDLNNNSFNDNYDSLYFDDENDENDENEILEIKQNIVDDLVIELDVDQIDTLLALNVEVISEDDKDETLKKDEDGDEILTFNLSDSLTNDESNDSDLLPLTKDNTLNISKSTQKYEIETFYNDDAPKKNNNNEIEFDLNDLELSFHIETDDDIIDEIDERFNILDSDIDLSFDTDEKIKL